MAVDDVPPETDTMDNTIQIRHHNSTATKDVPLQDIPTPVSEGKATMHTWRFWAIILSLALVGLLSAVEGTIITSALPTITDDLGGDNAYVWIPNAYLLASVAVLPLFGQASNIFGRRSLLLSSVALFVLGSGICGGAHSMGMLIAGRTVQGLGGGGMNLLIETVVTDIVALRERGKYMAIVMMGSTLGASVGPFLGGVITEKTTWRWCFYLNLPIGGAAFTSIFVFLRVSHRRDQSWAYRLKRIDYSGNAIFVSAIIAVLIALTWGGTLYSWSTYHIILPLILGFAGLFLFTAYEWTSRLCPEPSFPRQLVSNRTSAAVLMLTLTHAIVTYWAYYFLPIYFQGVKGFSPMFSGIYTLPMFAGSLLFAVVGGVLLAKLGKYKPLHLLGFALLAISMGLFSMMDADTGPAVWVWFQLIFAAGSGIMISVLLPAMQAPLDETLVATATGIWSFARYFGCIWGVTIPAAIFNNECRRLADTVNDTQVADALTGGKAYQYATQAFLMSLHNDATREQVLSVFTRSIRTVWLVAIAFAGLGFLVVFIEREINMRSELNTEFGMEPKDGQPVQMVAVDVPLETLPSASHTKRS